MIRSLRSRVQRFGLFRPEWLDDSAAQLVEFAVALPLLVVFVVGIFDFSSAFTLKQKLTNIARDAARIAAAGPASDLGNTMPASVNDAYWIVENYLVENKINDCGITPSASPPVFLTWTFTGNVSGSGCPPGGLTLTINRGYYFPQDVATQTAGIQCAHQAISSAQTAIISTCVSIQYAYQWRFGRVVSLLGRSATLPTTITATAVAMNEN